LIVELIYARKYYLFYDLEGYVEKIHLILGRVAGF
jgi:hypothetical protein